MHLTLESFIDLVARMREAQKDYFAIRTNSHLAKSKKLEADVDRLIRDYKYGPPPKQESLL